MKEHKFPLESLIGGWYIDPNICDYLITYFNTNKQHAHVGLSGGNDKVIKKNKESTDLFVGANDLSFPFDLYIDRLSYALFLYKKRYDLDDMLYKFSIDNYNIQHYEKNKGYYVEHIENDGKDSIIQRCVVFMTYLNDVSDGGTIFKNQKLTTPAKKGLTLFWPAYYSHIHRGQISKTSEKYIVTGWFSFEKNDK